MKQPRRKLAQLIADRALRHDASRGFEREVAAYLLSERRVGELASILRDVQADWAAAGHVEVISSSAHPLSAGTRSDIRAQVKRLYPAARQITITEVRDPAVIGGVRLDLPGRQLDLSVEAKLHKFKQLTNAGKD